MSERDRDRLKFLEAMADGADLKVNGVPWREMFERVFPAVASSADPAPAGDA